MFTNKKVMITIFSILTFLIVGMIATIIVFASQVQNVSSNISITYVAKNISGSISGTYTMGDDGVAIPLVKEETQETTITFDEYNSNVNGSLVP